jgi:hypothetical protein
VAIIDNNTFTGVVSKPYRAYIATSSFTTVQLSNNKFIDVYLAQLPAMSLQFVNNLCANIGTANINIENNTLTSTQGPILSSAYLLIAF